MPPIIRAPERPSAMSKNRHVSETPATQLLRQRKVAFTEHTYDYVDHGGAGEAARQLGLDPHAVVKTLIMEDEGGHPLVVLMHGDREVSTKNLERQAGLKKVAPCQPEVAQIPLPPAPARASTIVA
ncbi:regulatory protein [Bordetella pertussis]|nr:regulatory protein [Bordetella pertussis]